MGNTRIGASAIAKINRKDFGLVWNAALETDGRLVGDDVAITIDAEFIKAERQYPRSREEPGNRCR